MPAYTFTLILEADPTEEQVDRLYERFQGDMLSGIQSGVPYLDCHIEAPSFERAVAHVRQVLDAEALPIRRIEVEPDALPSAA